MSIKVSPEEAAFQLREVADDARWNARRLAWRFEEGILWRASDGARVALRRALRALQPLQRLIQTRLTWPLADRFEDYGHGVRTTAATGCVLVALGAATAGALLAGSGDHAEEATAAPLVAVASAPEGGARLQGVAPDFVTDPNAAAPASKVTPGAPPPGEATTSPDQVAWRFAEAFVLYEVGRVDEDVRKGFGETATRPLAAALGTDPPRLPDGSKVPEARVLNVVPGARTGKEMTVSVSLLRLKAASELRLTLRELDQGWRVAEVLG